MPRRLYHRKTELLVSPSISRPAETRRGQEREQKGREIEEQDDEKEEEEEEEEETDRSRFASIDEDRIPDGRTRPSGFLSSSFLFFSFFFVLLFLASPPRAATAIDRRVRAAV